jgi:hypothetical protein
MEQVIIGVDPHKLSATIEVVDRHEQLLGSGRFTTDRAGYAAMRKYATTWPERVWAERLWASNLTQILESGTDLSAARSESYDGGMHLGLTPSVWGLRAHPASGR